MAWDLATAKQYLGIDPADMAHDQAIQLTLDNTIGLVEHYIARPLLFVAQEVDTLFLVQPGKLYLMRYPIKQILKIDGADFQDGDALVDLDAGWIAWETHDDTVQIEYDGGYETLPPALEAALWEIFLMQWGKRNQWTGGPELEESASGEVSRVTVQDLGSISFDTGATAASSRQDAQLEKDWGILAPWAQTLQWYRRGDAGAGGLGIA